MTTLLSAAIDLGNQGFRVLPLNGKIPLHKNWPTEATTNGDQIQKLWAATPEANIGIATGGGRFVLDVDVGRAGAASLDALFLGHEKPKTITARTGGGGWHIWFAGPTHLIRNSRDKLGPGLDIRSEGGQVVAPPSVHPSTGEIYVWTRAPGTVEIAEAPQWLLDLLTAEPEAPKPRGREPDGDARIFDRASKYLARMDPSVTGSGGHDAAFKAAIVLVRGFNLSADDALGLFLSEFNPRCDPPWSEKEAAHKIQQAVEKSSLDFGYLLSEDKPLPPKPRPPEPPPPSDDDAPPPEPAPVRHLHLADSTPQSQGSAALDSPPEPERLHQITKSYASACQIMRVDRLREQVARTGKLEFNTQSLEPCISRQPVSEQEMSAIMEQCERVHRNQKDTGGIEFPISTIERAVMQVAHEQEFHPVSDYLRSLVWDGVPRIHAVAEDILGIDTRKTGQPLAPMLLRRWFVSAVARPLDPGCKVDTVLILSGKKQGTSKSTFFQVLAGADQFSDTPVDIANKDAALAMRYVWITEWAELEQLQGKTNKTAKGFISSGIDRLRAPYARAFASYPRTSVIVGTTNEEDFLTDPSGSRRYLCLRIDGQSIDLHLLAQQRDQLWAEAVAIYDAAQTCPACREMLPLKRCPDHRWWLEQDEGADLAISNAKFEDQDLWSDPVRVFVDNWQPASAMAGTAQQLLTTELILTEAIKKLPDRQDKIDKGRIKRVMVQLGWREHRKLSPKPGGGQEKLTRWVREQA